MRLLRYEVDFAYGHLAEVIEGAYSELPTVRTDVLDMLGASQ